VTRTALPTGLPAYAQDASRYDARTRVFEPWRRRVVDLLPVRPGEVVLDVGCGTGLCFQALRERVGPDGVVIGVDPSPKMLGLAARRVAERGWHNVRLHHVAAEDIDLPEPVDHAVLCAVHDVLRSEAALSGVLRQVRPGGSVAACGGKWAPSWAIGVNMMVLAVHAPFVGDFTGFDRPWELLAERVVDLRVEEVAMAGGYLAIGRVPAYATAERRA
jgi:demethylmenaquinone methyltransferase/2-methoxy-6-polyprenyl-1,4-benzoquinol methylase